MASNLYSDGKTIKVTAVEDILTGDPVEVGEMVVVAFGDIAAGDSGSCSPIGVWTLKKKANEEIPQGADVFIDANKEMTGTDTGSLIKAGICWVYASSSDADVKVKLIG